MQQGHVGVERVVVVVGRRENVAAFEAARVGPLARRHRAPNVGRNAAGSLEVLVKHLSAENRRLGQPIDNVFFLFCFKWFLDQGPEQRVSKMTVLCPLITILLISYIIYYYYY